jgi:hypothetical protein
MPTQSRGQGTRVEPDQLKSLRSGGKLTQLVGSATSTGSEYVISGLTPGQQYWMIVRAVRGSETGPWSDPATRVANV